MFNVHIIIYHLSFHTFYSISCTFRARYVGTRALLYHGYVLILLHINFAAPWNTLPRIYSPLAYKYLYSPIKQLHNTFISGNEIDFLVVLYIILARAYWTLLIKYEVLQNKPLINLVQAVIEQSIRSSASDHHQDQLHFKIIQLRQQVTRRYSEITPPTPAFYFDLTRAFVIKLFRFNGQYI